MLGAGRPCILELADCPTSCIPLAALPALQNTVNSAAARMGGIIELRGLSAETRAGFAALQSGADSKRKVYAATCWSAKPHSAAELTARLHLRPELADLAIQQTTPVRVMHRRALLTRRKVVHEMRLLQWLSPHFFVLGLVTSAGTYVKEFCHGDLGRTTPNVGSLLGCETDILQLDVLELHDDRNR
jgi:tRNA pseudouridine synthase 10